MNDSKVFPCAEVKRLTSEVVDPVVITAKSYTRVYGEENTKFGYEVSGAKLDGEPVITCAATATSPVGEYDIVVSKGTVTNYNDHYVAGKLTIVKAPLTITAKSCTRKQGETNPKFEVSYEGWKNGESSTVLKNQPVVTCEATAASEPGEYDIIVSGAEAGNYDIKYVAGKLTVTEADPVVVTAKSYTRVYGEENPKFGFESSGAKLDGEPVVSCAATATSPVGEYDIIVAKGTVKNYNDRYVAGKLTITKAPLTVTAQSYTRKQGEANPKFEVVYEGLKNGESATVLTKQSTVTCAATAASEPGEYDIVVSGAEATNYDIKYVAGKLTVTEADPVVVTAKSYTRVYGEENPKFGYEVNGAQLDGEPAITCAATATSPVGEYDIIVSKGTVKNYNDRYVAGKLTITKAPLTVTAKSYTRKQGEDNPKFEIGYESWKNGESATVLTKQPTVTCAATAASEPGEYDIVVSGAEATNYDIKHVAGKLTVTEADPVVVTAKSYTRVYGEENPKFGYEVNGAQLDGEPVITCAATATSPVGEYDIVVSKGTVKNYNDRYVAGKLTITKAPLTITAKSYTRKQGEDNPKFEIGYEGWKNGESATVLTKQPTVTCAATAASGPGEYYIIVSDAEATNYDIKYVAGKLTVTDADAVIVTAKSYTREYGEANPTFGYEVSGAKLDGEPVISCEATSASPVGEYDIIVSKGTVKNYNDRYVAGKLTITKAPLTITAKSYTRKQGEANPKFEIGYEGWKNGESETVLTKQPTVTCAATAASEPGDYYILVGDAEATNYDIKYVAGKLTVTDADAVIVTAKSYTREYGEANPTFGYEVSGAKLDGEPVISCEATSASPVGEYDIIVSKGTVKNYNDQYLPGKLTITKASLTITAKSYTREQGEKNPQFEVGYEGWKNGESATVLTKQPTVTCEATSASEPGEYDIIASGADAVNYTIYYVSGKLTVIVPAAMDSPKNDNGSTPTVIYTLSGVRVNHSGSLKLLPKGVYVIQQGSKTFKYVNR